MSGMAILLLSPGTLDQQTTRPGSICLVLIQQKAVRLPSNTFYLFMGSILSFQ